MFQNVRTGNLWLLPLLTVLWLPGKRGHSEQGPQRLRKRKPARNPVFFSSSQFSWTETKHPSAVSDGGSGEQGGDGQAVTFMVGHSLRQGAFGKHPALPPCSALLSTAFFSFSPQPLQTWELVSDLAHPGVGAW